jgi:hypothetical protein
MATVEPWGDFKMPIAVFYERYCPLPTFNFIKYFTWRVPEQGYLFKAFPKKGIVNDLDIYPVVLGND